MAASCGNNMIEYRVEADRKILNIILLGETGVGKSTFINSFPNYFQYGSFEEAVRKSITVLTPARIYVMDAEGEGHEFQINSDTGEKIEKTVTGSAETQNVTEYSFPIEGSDYEIRLIDTPGLADPEGVAKDDRNCETILNYLQDIQSLHAICILMSPKCNRQTVQMSYCLRQIFSRLDKSACDNIVFVFTSTSSEDYRPGETLPVLKRMISEINCSSSIGIAVEKRNIFAMDNECFKYAMAIQRGIYISNHRRSCCQTSWSVSKKRCFELIEFVKSLKPHDVENTLSLNQIRKIVDEIFKPLSDISELLQRNKQVLEEKKSNLAKMDLTVEELQKELKTTYYDLEITKLDHPVTICTSLKCIPKPGSPVTMDNISRLLRSRKVTAESSRKCHDPCTIVGRIRTEVIGHGGLFFCSQMNIFGDCKKCGCSYTKHMSIFYEKKYVKKEKTNVQVETDLQDEDKRRKIIASIIRGRELMKKELEEEHTFVSQCLAKFAVFLKRNAITPHCDAYKEYIDLSIQRERTRGDYGNLNLIQKLADMKRNHEELKRMIEEQDPSFNTEISANGIKNDIEKLFKLQYSGKKFKEICNKRAACVELAIRSSFTTRAIKSIKLKLWG